MEQHVVCLTSLIRGYMALQKIKFVSKNLWSTHSLDLSTCDFYLRDFLKVYETNPHTLDKCVLNGEYAVLSKPLTLHFVSSILKMIT